MNYDALYSFVFRGLLTEEALDAAGGSIETCSQKFGNLRRQFDWRFRIWMKNL